MLIRHVEECSIQCIPYPTTLLIYRQMLNEPCLLEGIKQNYPLNYFFYTEISLNLAQFRIHFRKIR